MQTKQKLMQAAHAKFLLKNHIQEALSFIAHCPRIYYPQLLVLYKSEFIQTLRCAQFEVNFPIWPCYVRDPVLHKVSTKTVNMSRFVFGLTNTISKT